MGASTDGGRHPPPQGRGVPHHVDAPILGTRLTAVRSRVQGLVAVVVTQAADPKQDLWHVHGGMCDARHLDWRSRHPSGHAADRGGSPTDHHPLSPPARVAAVDAGPQTVHLQGQEEPMGAGGSRV